ncbi:hypothetical protein G6F35_014921 [Rhizopus arrhizus]|nr:hypothetical protein G6F35_014921 [Rhizopus arrhizus]
MRGNSLTWRSWRSRPASSSVKRRDSRLFTVSTSVSAAGMAPMSGSDRSEKESDASCMGTYKARTETAGAGDEKNDGGNSVVGYREPRGWMRLKAAKRGQVFPVDLHLGRGVAPERQAKHGRQRQHAHGTPASMAADGGRMGWGHGRISGSQGSGAGLMPTRGGVRRASPAVPAPAGTATRQSRPAPRPTTRPYRNCPSWRRRNRPARRR